jgi:hypothetical protein
MKFRFKLKGPKGTDPIVVTSWISTGKESDAREWAKIQMEAWQWTDGKILECAAEYVDPAITEKPKSAFDPDVPREYDERGLPILRLTEEDAQKLLAMKSTHPDVYVPEDDNL